MNGAQALEIIRLRFPEVKVIILSIYSEPILMYDFIAKGARAYLAKGCSVDALINAIYTVHEQGFYLGKEVTNAILSGIRKDRLIKNRIGEIALTQRELEILKALCDGKTNKEIAGLILNIGTPFNPIIFFPLMLKITTIGFSLIIDASLKMLQ